jgi:hypothetical protein
MKTMVRMARMITVVSVLWDFLNRTEAMADSRGATSTSTLHQFLWVSSRVRATSAKQVGDSRDHWRCRRAQTEECGS